MITPIVIKIGKSQSNAQPLNDEPERWKDKKKYSLPKQTPKVMVRSSMGNSEQKIEELKKEFELLKSQKEIERLARKPKTSQNPLSLHNRNYMQPLDNITIVNSSETFSFQDTKKIEKPKMVEVIDRGNIINIEEVNNHEIKTVSPDKTPTEDTRSNNPTAVVKKNSIISNDNSLIEGQNCELDPPREREEQEEMRR